MYISYPFQISNGRIAQATMVDHIQQLIEQLLFTFPGERVNRPDFGSGLTQLVFAPNNGALGSALEYLIQGAVQAYLGSLIKLTSLQINNNDNVLNVLVQYTILSTQQQQNIEINSPVPTAL